MGFLKKALSVLLAGILCVSAVTPAFAADADRNTLYDRVVSRYPFGTQEFVKISHPEIPASNGKENFTDGLLDYLGDGKLGVPGVDEGAENQGDRGQSYAWGSVGYGDWMYVTTLFSAMMATLKQMEAGGSSNHMDPEILEKCLKVLYRGDFFVGEDDGNNPGSTLSKINVKTGEVVKLLSKDKQGRNFMFRNGLVYQDMLYFCGSVSGIPSIYQVDPETDACTCIYQDPSMKSETQEEIMNKWEEAKKKDLAPAIRGMAVFGDYLVISCVGLDENPYIAVSDDPTKGFTKIASTWENVEEKIPGELFGYAACHNKDSIFGGGIWEMAEFNGKLYVAMCTGTPDNAPGRDTMQSFAIVCGQCNGDVEDRDAWTWTPIVGDQKKDNAPYPFGIDAERTRAGACTMMAYGDHLYVGEYNDTEIPLLNILYKQDFGFMARNLEQSVNLYRMDKNEHFEMVVGDPTEQFSESLSGLHSGFGEKKIAHENQYIWKMNIFQDKLYMGTFDETTLLYPFAQLVNGDLIHMTPEEWNAQLQYIIEFIEAILGQHEQVQEEPALMAALEEYDPADEPVLREILKAHAEAESLLNAKNADELQQLDLFADQDEINSVKEMHQVMMLIPELLDEAEGLTMEEQLAEKEKLLELFEQLFEFLHKNNLLPDYIEDLYEALVTLEKLQNLKDAVQCLSYLRTAKRGFDMVVVNEEGEVVPITRDGLGDPYNHGLRALAVGGDEQEPWLCAGTANPCYGTQIWKMKEIDTETDGPDPDVNPDPDIKPDPVPDPWPSAPIVAKKQKTIVLTIDDQTVIVDGVPFENDVAPMIRDDRTFIPARVVAENLGATVTWDAEKRTVTIVGENGTTIVLTIGSKDAMVNNQTYTMDVNPFIDQDRTYTPARFIAENLGATVTWDASGRQVTIVK